MKRPETTGPEAPGGVQPFPDANWIKSLPTLCAYLSDDVWDDGKPRDPSSLTIKCQEGKVLVILNDLEMRQSLYVTCETVMDGLKALEKRLTASGADWRRWKGQAGKGKKG